MFDDLHDLYQDIIVDRGRNPRHAGRLAAYDATANADNPMCGDRVTLWISLDGAGRIGALGFEGRGCAISLAAADLMAEALVGRTPVEAKAMTEAFAALVRTGTYAPREAALDGLEVFRGVAEFPSRVKCATLPWVALTSALGEQP